MANKFWVGGTGTWDSSTTTHWSTTTGGGGGAAAPTTGDTVIFDASSGGGTVTVDTTVNGISLNSIVAGAFTGTLDFSINNPSMTLTSSNGTTALNLSGTGARTFKLGSGTFTFSAGGTYDLGTTTNLAASTFSSATFVFNSTALASQQFFAGGGQTYGTLTINGRATGQGFVIQQNNTFGTINLNGPLFVSLPTTTTTTNLNVAGSSSNYVNFGSLATQTTVSTVNVTTAVVDRAVLRGLTFSTSAVVATNSIDEGNNSMNGGSITPPSGGGARMIGG
jgi:hypothetical protein